MPSVTPRGGTPSRVRRATDEHGSECATAGGVEMFRHGSPARARIAGLAGMTRFWCRGLTLPTTDSDVALVSPVSCCASTSSYPGSTGVSMPERFRLTSGEEQGRRYLLARLREGWGRLRRSRAPHLPWTVPGSPSAAFGVTSPASQGRIPGVAFSSVASRTDQLVSWLCLRMYCPSPDTCVFHLHRHARILPHLWGDHAKHGAAGS
ncbi:hypothetical protein L611_004400000210 [Aminobacter sp. J15]|nr:hypothetical protein L611_004400000210 [Aminobacter sp. J15]